MAATLLWPPSADVGSALLETGKAPQVERHPGGQSAPQAVGPLCTPSSFPVSSASDGTSHKWTQLIPSAAQGLLLGARVSTNGGRAGAPAAPHKGHPGRAPEEAHVVSERTGEVAPAPCVVKLLVGLPSSCSMSCVPVCRPGRQLDVLC